MPWTQVFLQIISYLFVGGTVYVFQFKPELWESQALFVLPGLGTLFFFFHLGLVGIQLLRQTVNLKRSYVHLLFICIGLASLSYYILKIIRIVGWPQL